MLIFANTFFISNKFFKRFDSLFNSFELAKADFLIKNLPLFDYFKE